MSPEHSLAPGARCRQQLPADDTWRGRTWRVVSAAAAATIVAAVALLITSSDPAQALPSFARQTGQPCGVCHTDFPGLTPFGRRFKIMGYTLGGGPYRTSLFSAAANSGPQGGTPANGDPQWVPPIAMMAVNGFTQTQAPLPAPTAPYSTNNNFAVSPLSFFWGGAVADHLGAFAQVTYSPAGPGGFGSDPFAVHTWSWDNTDIRYADTTKLGNIDIVYGLTANNSPTVQDPWNTTPAWAFPYAASTIAPTPGAAAIIDGTFAAHVGSIGAYGFFNDAVYLEASVYRTLAPRAQNDLGINPFDAPGLFGVAPYWRAAFEPHWGNHWLELGTFGMMADVHPFTLPGTPDTGTFSQADKYTDIGVDTQYQYQGDNFWFTLRGTYIHENQKLDASFLNGLAANSTGGLNEARAYASLAYGNDNRFVLTGQYFNTWGSPDVQLYAGNASGFSPNSDGWIAEIAYIPFMTSQAPAWPWFNARIGLQYVWYDKFDGTTVGAQGNNTLFLYAWIAM
jgi:hypothetical protein